MSRQIGYAETFLRIEKVMTGCGLRRFCTVVCQGACCSGCYKTDHSCKIHGRRLGCSAFICDNLHAVLGCSFAIFSDLVAPIARETQLYFKPYPLSVINKYSISEDVLLRYEQFFLSLDVVNKIKKLLTQAKRISPYEIHNTVT